MPFLKPPLCAFLTFVAFGVTANAADVADAASGLQGLLNQSNLNVVGRRWQKVDWKPVEAARVQFAAGLKSPEALAIWTAKQPEPGANPFAEARLIGAMNADLQHAAALEMLAAVQRGDLAAAQTWRSTITLPKRASTLDGAKALQQFAKGPVAQQGIERLLAREYLSWQTTRIHEGLAKLRLDVLAKRTDALLFTARTSEIQELAQFPEPILKAADVAGLSATEKFKMDDAFEGLRRGFGAPQEILIGLLSVWTSAIQATLPNLLNPADILRKEQLIVKLQPLMLADYRESVSGGSIINTLEYQKAKSMLADTQEAVEDLLPNWQGNQHLDGDAIRELGAQIQTAFDQKVDHSILQNLIVQLEVAAKLRAGNNHGQVGSDGVNHARDHGAQRPMFVQ